MLRVKPSTRLPNEESVTKTMTRPLTKDAILTPGTKAPNKVKDKEKG